MPKETIDPRWEPPGSEKLKPKDRKLNLLAVKFERLSHALYANSFPLIKIAYDESESESGYEPAEVKTQVLANVKEQLSALEQLIKDIEETAGIIDVSPERKKLNE